MNEPRHLRGAWSHAALLLAIAAAALALRIWRLEELPRLLSGDEAAFGLEVRRHLAGQMPSPFDFGWFSHPTASFIYQSIGVRLFGESVWALRWPSALAGAAGVLAAGWMATLAAGRRAGWLTAVLVATFHLHIHFSRIALNNILDPLLGAAMVALLLTGARRGRPGLMALAGGAAGLGFYGYQGARLLAAILALTLLVWFCMARRRRRHRLAIGAAAALGGFILVAAPMLQLALRRPDDFMARLNQLGVFHSGWLEREVAAGRGTVVGLLLEQAGLALGSFHVLPDLHSNYGLGQPLLEPIFGALMLVGLAWTTFGCVRRRGWRLVPLAVWWWGGLAAGAFLIVPPPQANRLVTLSVPACFFIAQALIQIGRAARRAWPAFPARALPIVAAALFAAWSLNAYNRDFQLKGDYGGPHAGVSVAIAPLLRDLPGEMPIYFLGAPAMYGDFPTLQYLTDQRIIHDVLEPLGTIAEADRFDCGAGAMFVFLPERSAELRYVHARWPGGTGRQIFDASGGRVLAVLYEVAPDIDGGEGSGP